MIYLDSAATTKVYPQAAKTAYEAMTEIYANPSSLHSFGYEAEKIRENAREIIAEAANVSSDEIYFTSSGTAGNNLAVFGALQGKRGGRAITSAYEHPSVSECMKTLETRFEVVYLTPENGIISPETLKNHLTGDTVLVSIMHVNNETGAKNPVAELAKTTKTYSNALFHTDAVQGFLKEPQNYSFADMATFSAHKNHAPKGLGAVYIKKNTPVKPLIYGGGQERGLFCGTENIPAMAAWAVAASTLAANINERKTHAETLKKRVTAAFSEMGAIVVTPAEASPYVLSAAFPGYVSENIVHFLEKREIYVSTGAACSSKKSSAAYKALGMEKYGKSALRVSFSHENTNEEIEIFIAALKDALGSLLKTER